MPEQGPYISEITLYTPYAQVVLNSWRSTLGYSAQQAEQDYHSHADMIRVRVRIEFTPTHTAMQGVKPNKRFHDTAGLCLSTKGLLARFPV